MAASQLSLYNGALTILGERSLVSLTENREPRYKLDTVWDNGAVRKCLQMGQWKFASRSVQLDSTPSFTPSFGYEFAFDKPLDFVRLTGLTSDEFFQNPITRISDEANWWFASIDPIYVRYVSDDVAYGMDYSLWPPNFEEFVEHYLAYKVAPTITGLSTDNTMLYRLYQRKLSEAKATDAMDGPMKFPNQGSWSRARQGYGNGERGNNNGPLVG